MDTFKDRTVVITGAGGYLGSAMAMGFAIRGAYVYLCGRNRDKLEKVLSGIQKIGGVSKVLAFDVCDSEAVAAAIGVIATKFGRIDVLVNNAYSGKAGTFEKSKEEDFEDSYKVTVTAAAGLIRRALPLLRKAEAPGAAVVNVSSMYGLVSPDQRIYDRAELSNPPHYGAAKAALIQLTRYMACELAKDRIRINALCPGPFPSPAVCEANPKFIEKLSDRVPLGRIGQAAEIVGPTLFLSSPEASYVTGSVLTVDGGWTAW